MARSPRASKATAKKTSTAKRKASKKKTSKKKPAAKKTSKKKPAAKKAAKKKASAKKTAKKKVSAKKTAKKKVSAKKAAKKAAKKKVSSKKTSAKKPAAKKAAKAKPAAKKKAAKKTAPSTQQLALDIESPAEDVTETAPEPAPEAAPEPTEAAPEPAEPAELRGPLQPGETIPDFSLEGDDGQTYSRQSLAGQRFVLYFYPKDDTPGCTRQACDFRDHRPQLDAAGVTVLGVSSDTLESHGRFRDKYELNFPLLADPDREVAQAFGVVGEKKMYGKTRLGIIRSTFLVGPDGTVERTFSPVKVDGHAAAVLQAAGDA